MADRLRVVVLIVAVVCSLAIQPPVESSLGTRPTPPVVGMSGGTGAETAPVPNELEIWKYAITQGGLLIVVLLLGWSYRRDFLRKQAETEASAEKDRQEAKEDRRAFITLVEKNTTALVTSEQTNARLARAIETHRLVPPGAGV